MSEAIDVDGDGEITKDEFIKNAMECEFVCDMLQVGIAGDDSDSDDDWLNIIEISKYRIEINLWGVT